MVNMIYDILTHVQSVEPLIKENYLFRAVEK